jgi:hypothetical protein
MADETTNTPESTPKPVGFFRHITSNLLFSLIIFAVGIAFTIIFITVTQVDLVTIANKILNVGLVFAMFMIYKFLFHRKDFKNDEKISQDSIAISLDSGFFILAVALAVSL